MEQQQRIKDQNYTRYNTMYQNILLETYGDGDKQLIFKDRTINLKNSSKLIEFSETMKENEILNLKDFDFDSSILLQAIIII